MRKTIEIRVLDSGYTVEDGIFETALKEPEEVICFLAKKLKMYDSLDYTAGDEKVILVNALNKLQDTK